MSEGGPYGSALAGKRQPSSAGAPEYAGITGGQPPLVDQGLSNVYIPIRRAPLLPPHDMQQVRQGHPLFLYKPGARLTGEDGTVTSFGIQDINYGLHQRAVYHEMNVVEKLKQSDVPEEVFRYKEWPRTVEEMLSQEAIIPVGVLATEPNDVRFEYSQGQVPAQVEGLHHGIAWLWGDLQRSTTVGWHFLQMNLSGMAITDPKGGRVNRVAKIPTLQCVPMARHLGMDFHGAGAGDAPGIELDYRTELEVATYERRQDEHGLALGELVKESRKVIAYRTRGFGVFFPLGTSDIMMRNAPSKDAVWKAIRTYAGMTAIINSRARLSVWLEPNPRIPRL